MIKYIGSKRKLVPLLGAVAAELPISSACDIFAGTTRVGQELRRRGLVVSSNDLSHYTEQFGYAYIVADGGEDRTALQEILDECNQLEGYDGYFTKTFCEQARYFQPKNGRRVDAIRDHLDTLSLSPPARGILLTSLIEAADRVDSTTGVQMAYLKKWAARSEKDMQLLLPETVPGPVGSVSRCDANQLAPKVETDLTYIDPPYNQHSYAGNYHIWETLVRWDQPEAYGVARKREDTKTNKSAYNSKRSAKDTFDDLLGNLSSPWLMVSFSNEGYHESDHVIVQLQKQRKFVKVLAVDYKRYVGAQIGIHDLKGNKVGSVSHLRNKELLFLAGPELEPLEAACDAAIRQELAEQHT